jgi:hypothetical protein
VKYSTVNTLVSLTQDLATALRAAGYNVFWQQTGDTDAHTSALGTPLATVTLVKDFPANPTYIVRLKSDNAGTEEVVVPAFTLYLPDHPRRGPHLGLGHAEYTWTREMWIEGFAFDDFQQKDLGDLLHVWLNGTKDKEFPVRDHVANPVTPPALGAVRVEKATVERLELVNQVEAVRYFVRAVTVLAYEE